jgi:hypothetical protein
MRVRSRFRLLLTTAVLVMLFATVASVAAGAPHRSHPHRSVVMRGITNAATDGKRLVAWGEGGSSAKLVMRNDSTGRTRRSDVGRACDYVSVPAGAAGLFLVGCSGPPSTWMVLESSTGQVTPVGDAQSASCEAFFAIGRYWLAGARPCSRGGIFYRNWHTGEVQEAGAVEGDPRVPVDLDTTYLATLGPSRTHFVVSGTRVLASVRGTHQRRAIELSALDSRTRRFKCAGRCEPTSIGGGLALWLDHDGSSLEGYELTKRRRLSWSMPDSATVIGSTATRVYYTTPNVSNPAVLRDLKSFRWR